MSEPEAKPDDEKYLQPWSGVRVVKPAPKRA
jgi:hypothetical protein